MKFLIGMLVIILFAVGCGDGIVETALGNSEPILTTNTIPKTIIPEEGPLVPHSLDSSDIQKLKVIGCFTCHSSVSGHQECDEDEETCSICHKEGAQLIGQMVTLSLFTFSPFEITVQVGETVTWINIDDVEHKIISDQKGIINSGVMRFGDSFSHIFTEPGIFHYHSELEDPGNPEMEGLIIVQNTPLTIPSP
jgi:plastocyanin